jgi:peptidoglycan/LPS O-acetylase OafA/YrhL
MTISAFLKKENNNLDLIRIFLASMVIFGHGPFLNGRDDWWKDPVTSVFGYTYLGAVAVKLFFFISGMVVTNSLIHKKSVLHFVISRCFRLIPALLFTLLITVFVLGPILTILPAAGYFGDRQWIVYLCKNLAFETQYKLPGVFENNFYPKSVNGSLWSLRYEMACYIVMLALFVIMKRLDLKYLNIPILLIILDAFLPSGFSEHWLGSNPEINLLPTAFAFGAFVAANARKLKINLAVVAVSWLIWFSARNTDKAEIILIFTLCNSILLVSSNKLFLKLKPKHDISYGIYLWGFLIQQLIYYSLGHLPVALHSIIALVISIVLAFFSYLIIEKPFMRYGQQLNAEAVRRFSFLT